MMVVEGAAQVAALLARSNRLGSDPTVTNYAGGNTSCKADDVDPVTGEPRGVALGQGFRRRPRHVDRKGTCSSTTGSASVAGRRVPRCRARRRDGRCIRLLPARPWRRRAVHRHRDARPGRRAHHVDHLHPDAGIAFATAADGEELTRRVLRRPGGLGAVATAGFPARAGDRRGARSPSGRHRGDPRRARDHRLGFDE